jgi:hypothetical protein
MSWTRRQIDGAERQHAAAIIVIKWILLARRWRKPRICADGMAGKGVPNGIGMRLGFGGAARLAIGALGLLLASGCHEPTGPRTIANPDPAVKIPAIKQAVVDDDEKQSAAMVKALESDDPAVRLYAIEGLQRLTGQNFGYLYYASAEERAPAVARWRRWLDNHPQDR